MPETDKALPSSSLSSDRTVPVPLFVVSVTVPPSVTLSVSFTTIGASFTVVTLGSCVAVAVELLPSVTVTV